MKFKLNRTGKRLAIPDHVTRITGLANDSALEIHAIDGCIVITKAQMTAMDIITLTTALQDTPFGAFFESWVAVNKINRHCISVS